MEEHVTPGSIVLDVGAHIIGEYSLVASFLVGATGQVHAIEPQPQAAEVIVLNARLNGLKNIKVHRCAVADREGTMPFRQDLNSWGGMLARNDGGANLQVRCTTLDAFVEEEGIPRVRLIKLDAAGNEKEALYGGRRLLTSRQAPLLIYKLYHPRVVKERFGYEAREIVELLASWGYTMRALTEKGEIPFSPENCYDLFSEHTYGLPVLAWREEDE